MTSHIAIVGMACRYPDADSPVALWETVLAQRQAFRRIPAERLRVEDYPSTRPEEIDGTYVREAAILEGMAFDRVVFRVSGTAFRSADFVHWLALEVAAAALCDAGYSDRATLPCERTGVLLGNTLTGEFSRANLLRLRWPYVRRVVETMLAEHEGWEADRRATFLADLEARYKSPFPPPNEDTLAGALSNTVAGRICNHFDLRGGGHSVDGACASSLLAVVHGCTALTSGDLDVVLAGGVDLSLDPLELVGFARTGALSHGDMRVYDARPTGFLPGEGCGMVVLMRDEDAVAQGRRRYAVIRGWGMSSDGAGGLTRPEPEGQLLAIRRAYERAEVDPGSVALFEGHGTGTAVGDATELAAISRACGLGDKAGKAAIGSVKANIGHTKAAAGVAGLIKAAMAVHTQVLPPTTGCVEPHADLRGAGAPLRVLGRGELWPVNRPLRAGVSASGFGGINAHLVVDGVAMTRRDMLTPTESRLLASRQDAEVFLVGAATVEDLHRRIMELSERTRRASSCELADMAAALAVAAGAAGVRASIVGTSPSDIAERLGLLGRRLAHGELGLDPRHGVYSGQGAMSARIGFLFPGQGTTAPPDGGILRRRFASVDDVYRLAALPLDGDPVATDVAQPAIAAAGAAALRVLHEIGIHADVAVGHSLGEIVALYWARVMTLESLMRTACARGRAMASAAIVPGAMAAIRASVTDVEPLLADSPVVVAGLNGPNQTTVSGDVSAITDVIARARDRGWGARRLATSHAFHSSLVASAEGALRAHVEHEAFGPLCGRVGSTIVGRVLDPTDDLRALLCRQITSPVRFQDAIDAVSDGVDLWIEVGPGRTLAGMLEEWSAAPVISLDSAGASFRGMLDAAAAAYALGVSIDAQALFRGRFVRPYDLKRQPSFLCNPCEQAPAPLEVGSGARDRPRSSEPHTEPSSTAHTLTNGSSVPTQDAVLAAVRELAAARAELPLDAVSADHRLLGDLHLNSIDVAQLAVTAARHFKIDPSEAPTEFSSGTVGDVAHALRERLAESDHEDGHRGSSIPDGVATWVRPFTIERVPRTLAPDRHQTGAGKWTVFAAPTARMAEPLRAALATVRGDGVVVCLPPDLDEHDTPLLVNGARAMLTAPAPRRALFLQHGGGASAFARTLALEAPDATVVVMDVPEDLEGVVPRVMAEVQGARGFVEVHYDRVGTRYEVVARPMPLLGNRADPLVGPGDVMLVTGGAKGVATDCVLPFAARTGTHLVLAGRSPDSDPAVVSALAGLRAEGVRAQYVALDVGDAREVADAVRRIETDLGPLTAIVHAAGINEPRLLENLDVDVVRRTLAPKLRGLRNVMAAIDPTRLRLLITFGSTIGRSGLRGAASYALANDWLGLYTERIQQQLPHCRCLSIEWSVWSTIGMGTRLGQLGAMARAGVSAIAPEAGARLFVDLAAARLPSVRILATGRYGSPSLLPFETPELPLLRFLERPRVHIGNVELVADADVSVSNDPYLDDHVFRGQRLFPAVMGLEAMAQAAAVLTDAPTGFTFENVVFARPIVVPDTSSLTVRTAALASERGGVDVVLRSAETGFKVDHFRATCRADGAPALTEVQARADDRRDRSTPANGPVDDLYGDIFFHGTRFQCVAGYRSLHAWECVAEIRPRDVSEWFGAYQPQRLVLGDPAARDACIHSIQACVPQCPLLPAGVDRVSITPAPPGERLIAFARERSHTGNSFVYDLEVANESGRLYERWEGLHLRVVGETLSPSRSVTLLSPLLERSIGAYRGSRGPAVVVHVRDATQNQASEDIARMALRAIDGSPAVVRAANGKLRATDGLGVSLSHAGRLTLAVAAHGPVACDVEAIRDRDEALWRDLLTPSGFALAEVVCREAGEAVACAATRVWSARECLTKTGFGPDAPMVLSAIATQGWVTFRSGEMSIATYRADLRHEPCPLICALLLPTA